MSYSKITRRIGVGLWILGAIAAWCYMGCGLVTISKVHNWLSSFVEIAFALNTSMSVAKVRKILFSPLLQRCYNMVEDIRVNKKTLKVSEATIKKLYNDAKDLYAKFERRVTRELRLFVWAGLAFAFAAVLLLLTDCPHGFEKWVPLLLTPVIGYVVGVTVEYRIIMGEFAANCERITEDKLVKKDKETERNIKAAMKRIRNKSPIAVSETDE